MKRPRLPRKDEDKSPGTYPGHPYNVPSENSNKDTSQKLNSSQAESSEVEKINPELEEIKDKPIAIQPPELLDEYAVSAEDIIALGPKDLNMSESDDQVLNNNIAPLDDEGYDNDVPDSEFDHESESRATKAEDDNNNDSLNVEDHDDLEKSKRQ